MFAFDFQGSVTGTMVEESCFHYEIEPYLEGRLIRTMTNIRQERRPAKRVNKCAITRQI